MAECSHHWAIDCGDGRYMCYDCGYCWEVLEPVKRTYDADELGIDQEED